MWRRQWYADSGTETYFLCPLFESWITLFRIPIVCMLWLPTAHSLPNWPLFHRQVRKCDRTLAPHKVLDFFGVLLQHKEIQVVEVQELTDFICQSPSQLIRFATRGDGLADADDSSIELGVRFTRSDRVCAHE